MSTLPTTFPRPVDAGRLALVAVLLVLQLVLRADSATAACEPWPGDPTPLPTYADPDPLRARWAELHSRELRALALPIEALRPAEGYRIWQRVLCLDPENAEARRGISRTYPIAIHRPPVSVIERAEPEILSRSGDPWAELAKAVILYIEPPPPPVPEATVLALIEPIEAEVPLEPEIDHAALAAERKQKIEGLAEQIAAAEGELRRARFRIGLAALRALRGDLAELESGEDLTPLEVHLETLAATAHVALGQQQEAHSCLARAFAANPDFELDPATTSPRVMLAFHLARANLRPREGAR